MKDYNTIIGILGMRLSDHTYAMFQSITPKEVERFFYPPTNFRKKELPLPDYRHYYDRIHKKGSKLNIAYFWIKYKQQYSSNLFVPS